MAKSPKFQSILITGASSGIGAALALHYAAPEISLALQGRNEERLQAIRKKCEAKGAFVEIGLYDVRDTDAMAQWVLEQDELQPFDLVIANAGISGGTGGPVEGESVAQSRKIFDVNLIGILNTIDPILPRLIDRKSGQIALMSSLASFSGWPGAPAYSASKGAIRLYGEGLRGALKPYGVRVNVICPGFIQTPLTDVNSFPMPFLMSAEKAAEKIAVALQKNKGRYAFPLVTYFFAGLIGLMPYKISSFLMSKLPEKPSSV